MTIPESPTSAPVHEALERPLEDKDMLDCAAYTLGVVSLRSFVFSGDIERRYLDDHEVLEGDGYGLILESSLVALYESGLYDDDGAHLVDLDFLEERVNEALQVRKAWPRQLIERARTKDVFVREESWEIQEDDSQDRWHIDPGTKDDPSPYLTSWHTEGNRVCRQIVRLDDFNDQDPEFLQQHLRELHGRSSIARMAQRIMSNREIHNTSAVRNVPEFMQEIIHLPPDQRQRAIWDILALMRQITLLDHHVPSRSYMMATDLSNSPAMIRFSHMFSCPTQPENVKDNNEQLFHFGHTFHQTVMEKIREAAKDSQDVDGNQPQTDIQKFLERPYDLLPGRLDEAEAILSDRLAAGRKLAAFIEAGIQTAGPEEFLALFFQDKMFPACAEYVDIRAALEEAIQGGNHLDDAISWAAKEMNRNWSSKAWTQEDALYKITRGFATYRSRMDQINSITFDEQGQTHLEDPGLRTALVLLACKQAKTQPLDAGESYDRATQLEADILDHQKKQLELIEKQIEENDEARITVAAFKAEYGITDEDAAWLSPIGPDEKGHFDSNLFMIVFHGLLLEKQSKRFNLRQPSMIAFIRDFLKYGGELSAARTEKLAQLFPENA